jgi:hypothetical protein
MGGFYLVLEDAVDAAFDCQIPHGRLFTGWLWFILELFGQFPFLGHPPTAFSRVTKRIVRRLLYSL